MVKVLLERTIKGKHVSTIVRLLRQIRVLAMQQPGYISGETLHAVHDPNHYLVISTWENLRDWKGWEKDPQRQDIVNNIEALLSSPSRVSVFATTPRSIAEGV